LFKSNLLNYYFFLGHFDRTPSCCCLGCCLGFGVGLEPSAFGAWGAVVVAAAVVTGADPSAAGAGRR